MFYTEQQNSEKTKLKINHNMIIFIQFVPIQFVFIYLEAFNPY